MFCVDVHMQLTPPPSACVHLSLTPPHGRYKWPLGRLFEQLFLHTGFKIYTSTLCKHIKVSKCMSGMFVCKYVRLYACVCKYMYVYMHAYASMYVYMHAYASMYVYMHAYASMYVYMHAYA